MEGSGFRQKTGNDGKRREEIAMQTTAASEMAIVASVTTAFLDATIRDSKEAMAWLLDDSSSWLKEYAKWLHK